MSHHDVDVAAVIRELDSGRTRVDQLSEQVGQALSRRLGLDLNAIQAHFGDRAERERNAPTPGGPAPALRGGAFILAQSQSCLAISVATAKASGKLLIATVRGIGVLPLRSCHGPWSTPFLVPDTKPDTHPVKGI